ncbi:Nuclear envelope morphology protein-like protein [Hapsidospora chrysogenum ATCC 11550]|uniref:Nuclear envelope morphology protein-like protein n=1 Tax=Hapsidospora chrysogenum (strain ATCC 11550 / CBS 779.69 / DSM 880 / IAM 14645 / JCM 23072 / IMI 49137) TaxID=857340 RepID=A0A086T9X9_HAPC1|nr:Nuclear envelope morphology protein-like protein [Hapsidospora chrysogenum ATCC 11550]
MNSFNIITSRVSPATTPAPSRSNSVTSLGIGLPQSEEKTTESSEDAVAEDNMDFYPQTSATETHYNEKHDDAEDTPLIDPKEKMANKRSSWWHRIPRDFASSILSSIRWVFVTLASPGVYLIACLYDERGNFAPWAQVKTLFGVRKDINSKVSANEYGSTTSAGHLGPSRALRQSRQRASHNTARSSSIAVSSGSESDEPRTKSGRHARSKSLESADEINPGRKSIRIKLNHDEGLEKRKHRKTQSAVSRTKSGELGGEELSAHLKSPTSPVAALTKYPRAPAPPRPLIPRRQPSYLNIEPPRKPTKTLILDLDETLIHSMSKGGKMSTGHMVEVRLNAASLGMGSNGPVGQHPILYWVNKRPYCDEFLRRVVKWFNLVIFTASVQEYADPVIDWLESEKKFFSARYYRQHCTYRQGAYIKDLSSIEPDLSNVMILDNSPLSYLFHEG